MQIGVAAIRERHRQSGQLSCLSTAPPNVEGVIAVRRSESSITLQLEKVKNITTYTLKYDDVEMNISEADEGTTVVYSVAPLAAARKYNFTLFTVEEGVRSSGYTFYAVTGM